MLRNQTPSGTALPTKNTRDLEVHLIPSSQSILLWRQQAQPTNTFNNSITILPQGPSTDVHQPLGGGCKRLLLHWRWRIGLFFGFCSRCNMRKQRHFRCPLQHLYMWLRTFSDLIPAGSPLVTQAVNETFLILYSRKESKSFQVSLYREMHEREELL